MKWSKLAFRKTMLRAGARSTACLAAASFVGALGCSSDVSPDGGRNDTRPPPSEEKFPLGLSERSLAATGTIPDPTQPGPNAVTSAEYRFAATEDPDVLRDVKTELWARVYRPTDLGNTPHPLIVFLHGNHYTCGTGQNPRIDDVSDYTDSGTCPSGYVVTPNHLGYGYLAERLASLGYVVVSINANRGITAGQGVFGDEGLNLARGRLVLKHLQRLGEWNANGGTPASLGVELKNKLDLSQVGLVGHSRGGEGVRAAYNLYRDPGSKWPARIGHPVGIRGIFEIAPVDGQTHSRTLDADGTAWAVLLPMCDGDVYGLSGIKPFDRMLQAQSESSATMKAVFTVWGANHNFYNTEWQTSDSTGCVGHRALFPQANGSAAQRTTGLASIMAFFRAHVGAQTLPIYDRVFNPLYALPDVVSNVTRVDRGYTDSPHASVTRVREDFDQAEGTSSAGFSNDAVGITLRHDVVPDHDESLRAGLISWTEASDNAYFQTNWAEDGQGDDLSAYKTLDFRVARQRSTLNPAGQTDFGIRLVLADGTVSNAVSLANYVDLTGPVGGIYRNRPNYHSILQSVRIPLGDFGGVDLTKVRGARFVFNATSKGAIYLANVRLSTIGVARSSLPAIARIENDAWASRSRSARDVSEDAANAVAPAHFTRGNAITRVRDVVATNVDDSHEAAVEIELRSDEKFLIGDALPILQIGERAFDLGYQPNGDTHRIVFVVRRADFAQLSDGVDVSVHLGAPDSGAHWSFGHFDKRALRR
ncbi:hypothetical protein LZC95_27835 [Pendulispora brunnea]|uniref:Alpha/beta hydrolase n=1 Tax=Pendulispora brunnea TaxID=2905690 RepID=A0ABZ2JZT8_9BACT